jgi:SAM-dependent methyltransferase
MNSEFCIALQMETPDTVAKLLKNVHPAVLNKFYGCGSPLPGMLRGTTVLDLGCGSGRDVYIAAQLVGSEGKVIGVDMTHQLLQVAEEHKEWYVNAAGCCHGEAAPLLRKTAGERVSSRALTQWRAGRAALAARPPTAPS